MNKWQYEFKILVVSYVLKIQLFWLYVDLVLKYLPRIDKVLLITELWSYELNYRQESFEIYFFLCYTVSFVTHLNVKTIIIDTIFIKFNFKKYIRVVF
jgi:hypothetical protein